MNIQFRLPGNTEKPIRVVTRRPVEWYESISSADVAPEKITRTVEITDTPIRIEGNLFFIVEQPIALLVARTCWAHVLDEQHILEVHYPNRVAQRKPHENKVVINVIEGEKARIAINVDNLLWTWKREDVIDPKILEHLVVNKMGKEIIAECCKLTLMRYETSGGSGK